MLNVIIFISLIIIRSWLKLELITRTKYVQQKKEKLIILLDIILQKRYDIDSKIFSNLVICVTVNICNIRGLVLKSSKSYFFKTHVLQK